MVKSNLRVEKNGERQNKIPETEVHHCLWKNRKLNYIEHQLEGHYIAENRKMEIMTKVRGIKL